MKRLLLITGSLLLGSCAGELTPDQAREAAEAARAWGEVARDAREIMNDK